MNQQHQLEYDENKVREILREYSPEQEVRMLFILDNYYYDGHEWQRKR